MPLIQTRLVLHGSMKISFKGEVRFYIKGNSFFALAMAVGIFS